MPMLMLTRAVPSGGDIVTSSRIAVGANALRLALIILTKDGLTVSCSFSYRYCTSSAPPIGDQPMAPSLLMSEDGIVNRCGITPLHRDKTNSISVSI